MTETIFLLILLAALVYGLQRNHVKLANKQPVGNTDFEVRDTTRTHPILSP
ncbi:hypothetical protein LWC34_26070 [Kibdelosporangium philippinense]|uniref:Uncharacterized protein n=1 Tax=Kibdelosporangium philippinense TaxID=211113 RepID=A0ABS8ZHA2_9PSEU|nr:hypothetical protein [Kibdelosporangium philippinense]MCE7006280.1 hypothetical protein [Kibdelosporangium philippinense]